MHIIGRIRYIVRILLRNGFFVNVFIFYDKQWNFAGQLFLQATNPLARHNYSLARNDFSIGEDHFAYDLDYAKRHINRNDGVALNSHIPVRLMEVFRDESLNSFLEQFRSHNTVEISPNFCIGNIRIEPLTNRQSDSSEGYSIDLIEWLNKLERNEISELAYSTVGHIHDLPYWFGCTDGNSIFPTRKIEKNPDLIPFLIPVGKNGFELKQHVTLIKQINAILGHQSAVDNEISRLPDKLKHIAFCRFDIKKGEGGYEYTSVETVRSFFAKEYSESEDLCEFIISVVSTYTHFFEGHSSAINLAQQLLERSLLYRLFKSTLNVSELHLIKESGGVSIAPVSMELFDSRQGVNVGLDWPYPLMVDGEFDVPLICESLAEVIDPQSLLLRVSDFADKIAALSATSHLFASKQAVDDTQQRVAMLEQKLARWGVLL